VFFNYKYGSFINKKIHHQALFIICLMVDIFKLEEKKALCLRHNVGQVNIKVAPLSWDVVPIGIARIVSIQYVFNTIF